MKSYHSIKAELDALSNILPKTPSREQVRNYHTCQREALKYAGWTIQRFEVHKATKIVSLRRIIVWYPAFGGSWRNADDGGEVEPMLGDIIIQEHEPWFLPGGLYPHNTGRKLIWEVEEE